jgi:hypothetical protein
LDRLSYVYISYCSIKIILDFFYLVTGHIKFFNLLFKVGDQRT